MKKYCVLLVILLSSILKGKAQFTEIQGVYKKSTPSPVKLFKVVNGRMEEIASSTPAANGLFAFTFKPEYKGYYVVGEGLPVAVRNKYKLYIKGNDKINLELTDSTYVLTGVNNKENKVLEKWFKLTYSLARKALYPSNSTFVDFFPDLEATAAMAKGWAARNTTGNAEFDQLMKTTVDFDLAFLVLDYLNSGHTVHPTPNDYTAYLKNFNADQFLQREKLFKFHYGARILWPLAYFKTKDVKDCDKNVMAITDDKLKGE